MATITLRLANPVLGTGNGNGPPTIDENRDWSFGISASSGIPDESTGACAVIWRYSLTQPHLAPFSVRTAKMVSKLRWIPEAASSPIGLSLHPRPMYRIAVQHAAHQTMLRRLGDKTGIVARPHDFRPGFATTLRRMGVGELDIAQMGRWSSLEMVQRYTKAYSFEDAASRFYAHDSIASRS
jgi:integrase